MTKTIISFRKVGFSRPQLFVIFAPLKTTANDSCENVFLAKRVYLRSHVQ